MMVVSAFCNSYGPEDCCVPLNREPDMRKALQKPTLLRGCLDNGLGNSISVVSTDERCMYSSIMLWKRLWVDPCLLLRRPYASIVSPAATVYDCRVAASSSPPYLKGTSSEKVALQEA